MTKSSKLRHFGTGKALLSTSGKKLFGRSNPTSEKVAALPVVLPADNSRDALVVNGAGATRVEFEMADRIDPLKRIESVLELGPGGWKLTELRMFRVGS